MKRIWLFILALAAAGCVDFQTALSDCEQTGRCGDEVSGGGGGGADAGVDAGCVDLDGDGLGPGCAQPDCDDTDIQRPLQLPCRAGAYVCRSCAGASDNNSGAPDSPLTTIAAGISFARSLKLNEVQVANSGQFTAAIYTESFDMAPGVSVVGRYYVADSGWQYPSAVLTTVHNTRPDGIVSPAGVERDSRLSGFLIRSIGGDAGTAITIRASSPTIEDVSAGYPLVPGDVSYGVRVEGIPGGTQANPLLDGVRAFAVTGAVEAIGVSVNGGAIYMRGGVAYGGTIDAGGTGVGIRLVNAPRSTVISTGMIGCINQPPGLATGLCAGLRATGDISGIAVGGSEAYGSYGGSPVDGETIALDFALCGPWDGGQPATVVGNSTLLGAFPNGNNGVARGVRVREGCAVDIVDNALIQGATGIGDGGNVAGIVCFQGAGTQPRCSIRRNVIQSHVEGATPFAYGVRCGCSKCDGGCVDVIENEIDSYGGPGGTFNTLVVQNASPLVARNRINLKQADFCKEGIGARFTNSGSRVENNFIRGGSCADSIGVVETQTVAGPGPVFHSNSITAGDGSSIAVGLYVQQTVLPSQPHGRFINNIISTGNNTTAPTRAASMFEYDALPLEFTGNLMHANTAYAIIEKWGYFPSSPQTSASANAKMTYAKGNFDVDPGFVSWRDFHLAPGSPAIDAGTFRLIDAGTFTPGPVDDIDREPRPLPGAGFLPAVGADQP